MAYTDASTGQPRVFRTAVFVKRGAAATGPASNTDYTTGSKFERVPFNLVRYVYSNGREVTGVEPRPGNRFWSHSSTDSRQTGGEVYDDVVFWTEAEYAAFGVKIGRGKESGR